MGYTIGLNIEEIDVQMQKRKPVRIMYFANLCNTNVGNHIGGNNDVILRIMMKYA